MVGLLDPVTQMSGFTTQLDTWEEVKAIADFTWPIDVESPRRVVSSAVDLNGSFFVTPVSVLTTDQLVYGAVIKNTKCVISGDSDGDSYVEDNGSSVVVEDLGALRSDVERKALRFITGMSGRVKLECPRAIAQADDAGELIADA